MNTKTQAFIDLKEQHYEYYTRSSKAIENIAKKILEEARK